MRGWIAVLGLVVAFAAQAQVETAKAVLAFPRYKQMQGKLDADGLPISGAKLCLLSSSDTCFTVPSHSTGNDSKVMYEFGLEPKSERLQIAGGGSLIFFTSRFSGGGSGTLERLAVLRYEADGRLTNLLPYVAVASQGQRAMWSIPGSSPYPVLITANFFWDFAAGETRWDRHVYTVEAYRFNPAKDSYDRVFDYRSAKKYDSGDSEPVRVLQEERAEILRWLGLNPEP